MFREMPTPLRAIVCVAALASSAWGQGTRDGQWRSYSGDKGSLKYSALDQIDADNVSSLEIAWIWRSPDKQIREIYPDRWVGSFEATPLMIDDILYFPTSMNLVAAVDARTGVTLWVYDPQAYLAKGNAPNKGHIHRGVTYWADGLDRRILIATNDAFLIALDANSGRPIADFGVNGRVDLAQGLRRPARDGVNPYGVNSPVVVCGDVIVVGSSVQDGGFTKSGVPGDVRGYDARGGERLWTFHTIPQDGEFGVQTWEEGSWEYTGHANVWTTFSADEDLGYVYLPISTPTNDWYGGKRLGGNLFAESLVCLDARTGKRVWHFQIVHHGLWDYDLPCAPILADIVVDGRPIKAVAQLTKQGFCFVFDRVSGAPVWPIEERAVPASKVPGERSSPTQPFPTQPPPFERQGVREEDVIDYTPEIHANALKRLSEFEYGPLYSPPSLKGTLTAPGWGGGANWGGGAFDPESGFLFVPSLNYPIVIKVGKVDPARSDLGYAATSRIESASAENLPLLKPPYSSITAIDLNRGEIAWRIPHGEIGRKIPGIDTSGWGGASISACLATRTLLFVGEGRSSGYEGSAMRKFRAFDKSTGEIVWEYQLPLATTGAAMTYSSGGKQHIVVATGGGRTGSSELVAFTLRQPGQQRREPRIEEHQLAFIPEPIDPDEQRRLAEFFGIEMDEGPVDLARVKIAETIKSEDICPVHLTDSDPSGPRWSSEGVEYRGDGPDCRSRFDADPARFAEQARRERWIRNFVSAMSAIWCPVSDQLNPGGNQRWVVEERVWESCCRFCDEAVRDDHFGLALERLRRRAETSFEKTGGQYVEGASSPLEGALRR